MNLPLRRERANWVKVLERMYELQMEPYNIDIDKTIEEAATISPEELEARNTDRVRRFRIRETTGPTVEEVENAIEYLRNLGLIHEEWLGLTQEGLQLAHQIKTERQQQKTNFILIVLTIILVVQTGFLIGLDIFS